MYLCHQCVERPHTWHLLRILLTNAHAKSKLRTRQHFAFKQRFFHKIPRKMPKKNPWAPFIVGEGLLTEEGEGGGGGVVFWNLLFQISWAYFRMEFCVSILGRGRLYCNKITSCFVLVPDISHIIFRRK